MWRAADKGMWRHMAGEGVKLQAKEYWAILLEEAENMHQKQGSGLANSFETRNLLLMHVFCFL